MKLFGKPHLFAAVYTTLLLCFTLYTLLDAFVIPRAYTVVTPAQSAQEESGQAEASPAATAQNQASGGGQTAQSQSETAPAASAAAETTDNTYTDENMTITITEYREYDTTIYVADIVLNSAEYLKTAFADNTYGRNITEKTSEIAESVGAILAINGDYYGSSRKGYVIKDGVVYREKASSDSQEDLAVYADGSFEIVTEGSVSAQELAESGVVNLLSFGPALVEAGQVAVSAEDEVDKAMTSNPRTAIGVIDNLHYVMVVSDGRTSESEGLSLQQLAAFMQGLGVQTAYNLDGGGSSTMWFMGRVVNNPTTSGDSIKERSVSDIVYIGY